MTLPGSRGVGSKRDRIAELLEATGESTTDALAVSVVEVAWPEVVEGLAGHDDGVDDAQDGVTDRDAGALGAPPRRQTVVLRAEVGIGPRRRPGRANERTPQPGAAV